MAESAGNIKIVPAQHGSKPDPALARRPPESFIGKWVKKSFLTGGRLVTTEHMWVKVEEVKNGRLFGTLANDPTHCRDLQFGMPVEVEMQEIEEVYG